MSRKIFVVLLASLVVAAVSSVRAQSHRPYRVGVIHEGGPYSAAVEGLKDGLRVLGMEPGRDVILEIRDVQGNRAAGGDAARSLERAKADLLFTVGSSITIAAKEATKELPIVFAIGTDATADGLVESPAKPGGRLTGVQRLSLDLTAKRLEILKEMLPNLHRVVTFYDPGNSFAVQGVKVAREAARKLSVEIKDRPITSVSELQQAFNALDPGDADALLYANEGMVTSQSKFLIDAAKAKKLATMVATPDLVAQGALAGYGVNIYDEGRLSAKYVQRILTGTRPRDLAVETFSKFELAINLQTARELGITVPQSVLFRADKVIE